MKTHRAALAARLAVAAATLILIVNLLGISASGAEPGASEVGVFENRILFGQSAALEGPAAALGLGMREGILAAFNEVNAAGGVKGRRLELVSRNDGYEPDKAIENTNQLLKVDQVFALIGEVGTPETYRRPTRDHGAEPADIRGYGRLLSRVLDHQELTLFVAILTLGLTVLLYIMIPKRFFPVQDTGLLQGITRASPAISFAGMAELGLGFISNQPQS